MAMLMLPIVTKRFSGGGFPETLVALGNYVEATHGSEGRVELNWVAIRFIESKAR